MSIIYASMCMSVCRVLKVLCDFGFTVGGWDVGGTIRWDIEVALGKFVDKNECG